MIPSHVGQGYHWCGLYRAGGPLAGRDLVSVRPPESAYAEVAGVVVSRCQVPVKETEQAECPLLRSLLGVKRTCLLAPHMSAFDPKRTFAAAFLTYR